MKWTDVHEIAIALADKYPETNPKLIRFTDLHQWVCKLPDFEKTSGKSNEQILEAIQAAWIEEADDLD